MVGVTPVNSIITDAITQTNVSIIADAPAQAMANTLQVFAQTVGASMQNAVSNQQGANTVDLAVTTQGTNVLYALSAAADAKAVTSINSGNPVAETITAMTAAAKGI